LTEALIVVSGVLVGALSGSMGIGGGTAMVPIMVIGFGFGETLAQGTSLAAIVPISLVGAFTHYRQGNVLVRPAIWMAAAGAPLAAVGAVFAQHVPGPELGRLFGLFLLFSAYRLWPGWKPGTKRS
jgi:uncharacterized protein